MRAGEKLFNLVCKPIQLLSPETIYTPCNLLAKAMVNNCGTEAKANTEVLGNSDIYSLGGYYSKKGQAATPEQ